MLRFINDLRAQIAAQLPDNNVGVITPAVLRGVLLDMCDSLFTRTVAALFGNFLGTPVTVSMPVSPASFPALSPGSVNTDAGLFTVAPGTITVLAPAAGFALLISVHAVIAAGNGVNVIGAVFKNGVRQDRFIVAVQCTGASELKSIAATSVLGGVTAGDVLDVRFWSPQGTTNVAFSGFGLNVTLVPVNSAF